MLEITLITESAYLFSVRLASFRWQELYSGLFTELGKLHINDKGNAQWVHHRGKIPIVYAVAD